MTADEVIRFVTGMPGAVAVTAGEASGAPEIACCDTSFFHDAEGDRRLPLTPSTKRTSTTPPWIGCSCGILNPRAACSAQARALLAHAHARAGGRQRRT
jgi:hypothetical protein